MTCATPRRRGFTLIELLTALLILSLLAVMSWRGLGAVLDTRERVVGETEKWQSVAAFCSRFERDLGMAAPRPVRRDGGQAPPWVARPANQTGPRLELSRFASSEGVDAPRRVAYTLNEDRQIELWLWSGLDAAPGEQPQRHAVLDGVDSLELDYLDGTQAWVSSWPAAPTSAAMPRAVRLQLVLSSGERVVRVFAVGT
ncbi:MAG: type II secretion system protein GspJ [Lysobacteraceae bacterium]|nr:MAG: type II secretion system protein GspJ [Xanthomonadaceae bacterium]